MHFKIKYDIEYSLQILPLLNKEDTPMDKDCTDSLIDYYEKLLATNLHSFFKFHPLQPFDIVSFNPTKAYFRKEKNLTFKR